MTDPAASATTTPAIPPAPTERGWGKLVLAIVAFFLVPSIPQLRALLPVDQTMLLFVPALAACSLVGWWAGGRAFMAIAWVALAVAMTAQPAVPPNAFSNLVRGWSLLLAGSFGLVCLFGDRRPLFSRAILALGITLLLAAVMSLIGPVTVSQATKIVADEFSRRNADDDGDDEHVHSDEPEVVERSVGARSRNRQAARRHARRSLTVVSDAGLAVFPALLALQSLAALALGVGDVPSPESRSSRRSAAAAQGVPVQRPVDLGTDRRSHDRAAADAHHGSRRRSKPVGVFRRALRRARLWRAQLVHGARQPRRDAVGRLHHARGARAQLFAALGVRWFSAWRRWRWGSVTPGRTGAVGARPTS